MEGERAFTWQGFRVWFVCALFFLYEFLLRTVVGTFQEPIMHDLRLSSLQFSLLSTSMQLVAYAAMQIPAGLLVDHHGLKKPLFVATLVCSVSVFGFACSSNYFWLSSFRVLMGLGSSFGFICLLVAVYDWMPGRRIGLWIGISQFFGTLGPMVAAGPLDAVSRSGGMGWRTVFFCLGGVGLVLALLTFLFVENRQEKSGNYIFLRKPERPVKAIKMLFARAQPWVVCLFCASNYLAIEYLAENEGKLFLVARGCTPSFASYMITLAWLGFAVGCPLLGFFSDRAERRKPAMALAACCCLLATILLVLSASRFLFVTAFLLLGVGAAGQSVGYAAIKEQVKKPYLALGLALNTMVMIAGVSVSAPVLGWVIDRSRAGAVAEADAYGIALGSLAAIAFLAVVLAVFFVKETFCKSAVDFTYLSRK